ncbi:MAG: glycosyltransferase family 4 protein [Vicinamibacterales bacterium]|jgi:hypothetical protein
MRRPLVLIGNPKSTFVQSMARYWKERGIEVAIVTAHHWDGPSVNADGVRVVAAEHGMAREVRSVLDLVLPVLARLESELHRATADRVATALASWEGGAQPPSLLPPLADGLAIAAAVNALSPIAVLGHEAFAYGTATALCTNVRRTLFAWGGDVLQFCNTSDTAAELMKSALQRVTYVIAGSRGVQQRIINQFEVPSQRTAVISLGVNRQQFAPAPEAKAAEIAARYGIPRGAEVVMNVRRLRPFWGSEVALEGLLDLASRRPRTYLVFLGGLGTEVAMAEARRRAASAGVGSRFIGVDGDAPLDQVAELMSISDVFVSLTQQDEPLSLSVLQCAASGGVGVIGDQATYREAIDQGLGAVLVNCTSPEEAGGAVDRLLADRQARLRMRAANLRYVAQHHDEDAHMERILRIVVGSEMAERLLAGAASTHSTGRGYKRTRSAIELL